MRIQNIINSLANRWVIFTLITWVILAVVIIFVFTNNWKSETLRNQKIELSREIEMLSEESLKEKTESSGPWMQELEQYVQNYDLPGIAAQTLLLKAKLCHRQGQFDEVRKILKEVKKRAEAPSMRYLNDLAISMFPDIIVI